MKGAPCAPVLPRGSPGRGAGPAAAFLDASLSVRGRANMLWCGCQAGVGERSWSWSGSSGASRGAEERRFTSLFPVRDRAVPQFRLRRGVARSRGGQVHELVSSTGQGGAAVSVAQGHVVATVVLKADTERDRQEESGCGAEQYQAENEDSDHGDLLEAVNVRWRTFVWSGGSHSCFR